jgi:hypothetical protein
MEFELVIKRMWSGHRALVIGVGAIAIVAILASSLILVAATGGLSSAGRTPSGAAAESASASPSDSPTPFFSPTPTINTGPTPLPAGMAYSDLDGVAATTALAHRLPLAIMIDDQKVARPQSGISQASIVYMAPADGDVDRYMMVFQEQTVKEIGPVRSARPYYVLWAAEYQALYGHFGGDWKSRHVTIPAMAKNIYNMDGTSSGGCPYYRVATRPKPHNAYTSTTKMIGCAAAKKYPATYQNMPTRPFTGDTATALLPKAQTISIVYPTITIGYKFNPATDSYLRLTWGGPEIDPGNGKQVIARSIIVMYQKLTVDYSEPNHARPVVANVGSGKAIVFQEGKQIAATWKKTSNTALTRFYDSTGQEISLVRGEVFIQSIPPNSPKYTVTVK